MGKMPRGVWAVATLVVTSFTAGVGALAYLEPKIKNEVKEALLDAEVRKNLPKGDKGDSGEPGLNIPVGGVISYAGKMEVRDGKIKLPSELESNFEICDGEVVKTSESPILGMRKPKMQGNFVRGMNEKELNHLLKVDEDRDYPGGGQDDLVLDHSHGAGTLAAMYSPRNGGWVHYNFTKFPRAINLKTGQGANPDHQSTGDVTTDELVDVEGDVELWKGSFDNRPEHTALVFIIRTK